MSRLLPLSDTDFGWLRYFCGILLPVVLTGYGIYSIISLHSYALWHIYHHFGFVKVDGQQAVLMGIVYLGLALMLFANCYAQYHKKMAYWYEWILGLGAVAVVVGISWCLWIFIAI